MNIETFIVYEPEDGPAVKLVVRGRYDAGYPAKLNALPEDCYPGEGPNAEVEALLGPDLQPFTFPTKEAEDAAHAEAEEALLAAGERHEPDYPEPDEDE